MLDALTLLLMLAGIAYAAFAAYRRLTTPKGVLAQAVADALLAEMRRDEPDAPAASLAAALLAAPDLLQRATAAFAARHPELPAFTGSDKLEAALRRQLQAMVAAPTEQAPSPPSRASLIAGIVLLAVGVPVLLACGFWMGFFLLQMQEAGGVDAPGSQAADANLALFMALFGVPGAGAGLVGGGLGYWLVRRYRRATAASGVR